MVSLLCPGSQSESLCEPSKSRICFPQSCGASALKPCLFQSQVLLGFLLPVPDLQAGEPDMGLRTLTPVGDSQQYNYFTVCRSPTWKYGI